MAQITITGEARSLSGALLTNTQIILRRVPEQPVPNGGIFNLPEPVALAVNGAGAVSQPVESGIYAASYMTAAGEVRFPLIIAPSPSSQTLSECMSRIDATSYDPLALALLAAGLKFYETTTEALNDPDLASGAKFVAPHPSTAVLTIYKKQPIGGGVYTASLIAAVFPQAPAPSGTAALPGMAFAADLDTGLYNPSANQLGMAAGGILRALLSSAAFQVDVPITGSAVVASSSDVTAGRLLTTGAGPAQAFRRGNILGTVAQSGGVPTGAVIERGSNANGEFVKFADGTMICTAIVTVADITTATGSIFTSAEVAWTFPAAFATVSAVFTSLGIRAAGNVWGKVRATSATAGGVKLYAATSIAGNTSVEVTAIGRWF
jgi:hypothetical protein